MSTRHCWAIRFFEEVLVIQLLSDFQQKLFWFFKKVPLLKLHFTCAEEKYMESFFLENVNSKIALGLRSGNSANRKVLVNQVNSGFQRKLFWLFRKNVVVKLAIYLPRWKCFWTFSLWKKIILYLLGTSIWKSSEFRRNFSRMDVKTAFKVFGRFFWW